MAILQVRDIDDRMYEALKFLAKQERRSISQEVVKILETHLSMSSKPAQDQTESFLMLTGAWEGDETAEEMIADIRSKRVDSSRLEASNGLFD